MSKDGALQVGGSAQLQGRCEKCGQEVVREPGSHFWVLLSEQGTGRATLCPEGGIHEVEDDD